MGLLIIKIFVSHITVQSKHFKFQRKKLQKQLSSQWVTKHGYQPPDRIKFSDDSMTDTDISR